MCSRRILELARQRHRPSLAYWGRNAEIIKRSGRRFVFNNYGKRFGRRD